MKIATMVKAFAVSALMVLAAIPAAAQRYAEDGQDSLREVLGLKLEKELIELAIGYWEPRLNAYKNRVDEIFSRADLEKLNELRVQFAIFMQRVEQERKAREAQRESVEAAEAAAPAEDFEAVPATDSATTDVAVAVVSDQEPAEAAVERPETVEASEPQFDPDEYARQELERERVERALREERLAAREEALARGESVAEEHVDYEQYAMLPAVAKWMARGYRSPLDNLADGVIADLRGFADTVEAITQRFCDANAQQIARVDGLRDELVDRADVSRLREMARYPYTFKQVYRQEAEAFVLLYNGAGLGKLLGAATRTEIPTAFAESSALAQNTPNPASKTTTISYTLTEPSAATAIRVFDAKGEMVMELNQGARAAGTYQAELNVEELSSGWYLYQLATTTSRGDAVSSRALVVAR